MIDGADANPSAGSPPRRLNRALQRCGGIRLRRGGVVDVGAITTPSRAQGTREGRDLGRSPALRAALHSGGASGRRSTGGSARRSPGEDRGRGIRFALHA